MIKLLILAVSLLLSVSANANNPIRVIGIGNSFDSAKEDAFKKAIEIQVGVVILSQREIHNSDLVKNEIITYSAGYVDEYKVVTHQTLSNKTTLIVDVWVADSKLAHRLLSSGKSVENLEGDKLSTQYNSFLIDRAKGDKILTTILNDYPKLAYNVTQRPYQFKVDAQRNAILVIPFEIKWNYNYIVSLNEVLNLVADTKPDLNKTVGTIVVTAKNPKDYVLGKMDNYQFTDMSRFNQIRNKFDNTRLQVKMLIIDINNKVVDGSCISLGSGMNTNSSLATAVMGPSKKTPFQDSRDSTKTIINGNSVYADTVEIQIEPDSYLSTVLKNTHRVELTPIASTDCK